MEDGGGDDDEDTITGGDCCCDCSPITVDVDGEKEIYGPLHTGTLVAGSMVVPAERPVSKEAELFWQSILMTTTDGRI
jgi:hypothetical protein